MTIQEAKIYGKEALSSSPSPVLDTEVFLQEITGMDKTALLFNKDLKLTSQQEIQLSDFISKRQTGLPVAYITEHKEFYGLNYFVNTSVLIPKPDTEILVEKGIEVLAKKITPSQKLTILDMCTGSGCVGISIFMAAYSDNIFSPRNAPQIVLADISEKALDVARKNVQRLVPLVLQKNFSFINTNLFEKIEKKDEGTFDIIVSNPPYVPADESRKLLKDGRNEPLLALDGDVDLNGNPTGENDGLGVMKNLVPQAVKYMKNGAYLLCESGEYNAEKTKALFEEAGLIETEIFCDLEGQLRVTKGIFK